MNDTKKEGITLGRVAPVAAIIIAAVLGFIFLRDYLSFEALRENREALLMWRDDNYVLAAISFIALYIIVVTFSLPGAGVMTLTSGFLFGIIGGMAFSVIGASIGAMGLFLAVRFGLGEFLSQRMDESGGRIAKIKHALNENEISVMLLLRLLPIFPFFVVNVVPALVGVKFRNFALTTVVGIIPGSAVFASIGNGLGQVFARGEDPDLGILFEPHIIGPILGLAALSALPIVIKAIRGGSALPIEEN
ncbi:Uncharacterized membrane protein YdjX, TVP38/TMEM64 family, SNARE-associated domain [Monaibacterium marinum]|uniref:TVP38/TMEM64 family membrane protein n=1 Tax=Pontivivens marinum TaxID=1690039 RepID=A0A2C9CMZ0_9RHOB|nr:TVP38/TMEM64 family protein [Monaibacterium marinum]SOH92674.1 Uncharacterized membrane protein YdjX, TVP38/TMEM64 family, SNARE-associated domain [Monaibacterium marinum]